jgi:hypothetical protein
MVVGGLFAGVTENVLPLQMVAVCAGIEGPGLIVTVTRNVGPAQLPLVPETGVTV